MITKKQHPRWNEVLRSNDCNGIAKHLAKGINPSETVLWHEGHAASPPLCIAWKAPALRLLLEAGADPNGVQELPPNPRENWNYNLSYPLHCAASRENPEALEVLIEHGAKILKSGPCKSQDPIWQAILSVSSKKGLAAVRVLLSHFGKQHVKKHGASLLVVAAGNKSRRGIIGDLVELGADPNESHRGLCLPLQEAIRENNASGVEQLLEVGADPQANSPKASGYYGDNILSCIELAKKLKKRKLVSLLEAAVKSQPKKTAKTKAVAKTAGKKKATVKKTTKKTVTRKKAGKKKAARKKK
jgi:ankyrin repeat protein